MILAFIPPLIATFALILSIASNFWCDTIAFPPLMEFADSSSNYNNTSNQNNVTDINGRIPIQSFGPFFLRKIVLTRLSNSPMMMMDYYKESHQCVSLPQSMTFDGKWRTTQAFAIIILIVGTITTIFAWFSPCIYASTSRWKTIASIFFLCSVFQGFTLFLLSSAACYDNDVINALQPYYSTTCEWTWGARTNIASVILWIVSGFLMLFVIPPPIREALPPPETQTVSYTKNYDGTVSEVAVVKGIYVPNQGIIANYNIPEQV
jgi:hypothetical protein